MQFPLALKSVISRGQQSFTKEISLNTPLTVMIGPNGSGKTHVLRGLKTNLAQVVAPKKVRFLSAGRMGPFEQYRSDFDGQRGTPRYDQARYGNKDDANRRHVAETLLGDFQTLAARVDILIKIQERLRKLFQRDIILEWDAGILKAQFARTDESSSPYSSGREASGLMHLVGILASLYDDEVGALLLDEPEVSLHPQLQAFLLQEMLDVAGSPTLDGNKKIIIIATHSTEMVKITEPNDLASLAFCYDLNDPIVQVQSTSEQLKSKRLRGLIARLGQEHKLCLFSRRPLLVEGQSDAIICSALATKTAANLEAGGAQLLPVNGRGQMPTVAKLFAMLGKNPVVLSDADGIADGTELAAFFLANNEGANQKASALGANSAIELANSIYSDFCKMIEDHWSEISSLATTHPYWTGLRGDNVIQAKRRAALCALYQITESELASVGSQKRWLKLKARFDTLFELLESEGCFFLKKGTIESYYQTTDQDNSIGKPNAAVDEMEHLDDVPLQTLKDRYRDVLKCLSYAAASAPISEADSLRDILLATAAPALAKLQAGGTAQEIRVLLKTILGDRSNIFKFDVEGGDLLIRMESKILNVSGFPLRLKQGDDVIKAVDRALSPKLLS